jgi:type II secretory pathway pseudopilin PulG
MNARHHAWIPPIPSPRRGGLGRGDAAGKRPAFTLIEIVLAIGLAAVVVYLLTIAMELYMVSVDSQRTRVESAQLARTLLDQIAADLTAATLDAPAAAGGGAGGFPGGPGGQPNQPGGSSPGGGPPGGNGGGGGGGGGFASGSGPPNSSGAPPGGGTSGPGGAMAGAGAPRSTHGVRGNVEQIRIDRAAFANWERASRAVELDEDAAVGDVPVSVRYFFVEGDRQSAAGNAQLGVGRQAVGTAAAGLYRETIPTAALPDDADLPTGSRPPEGAKWELLAPEIVAFSLAYYNGTDLVDEWDPLIDRGLPIGVEITLTIAEPAFQSAPDAEEERRLAEGRYRQSELVEYRRFVRLPFIEPAPPAQALLPGPEQGGPQQAGGGQPGQGGQGGAGGGQPGGAQPGGGT